MRMPSRRDLTFSDHGATLAGENIPRFISLKACARSCKPSFTNTDLMVSFGVHNEEIPWTGNQAYGKNLRIQMGRCPVRSNTVRFFGVGLN